MDETTLKKVKANSAAWDALLNFRMWPSMKGAFEAYRAARETLWVGAVPPHLVDHDPIKLRTVQEETIGSRAHGISIPRDGEPDEPVSFTIHANRLISILNLAENGNVENAKRAHPGAPLESYRLMIDQDVDDTIQTLRDLAAYAREGREKRRGYALTEREATALCKALNAHMESGACDLDSAEFDFLKARLGRKG